MCTHAASQRVLPATAPTMRTRGSAHLRSTDWGEATSGSFEGNTGIEVRNSLHAGLLVMAGSYEPALDLLLLCQHSTGAMQQGGGRGGGGGCGGGPRGGGRALSTSLAPGEGASGGGVEGMADIPQSLLLLPQPPQHAALQARPPFDGRL